MRRAATVLVVVAAATAFAACGSDDSGTTAGTSNPTTTATPETTPPTTEVPATEAPTTAPPETRPPATDAPTTTVGEPVLNGFDPPCVEATSVDGATAPPLPDTFGPLAVSPALTIELPLARSESQPTALSAVAQSVPTDSGLLLAVSAGNGEFPGSALSLVGWDGPPVWTRCPQDDVINLLAAPNATSALLQMTPAEDYVPVWYDVAVGTGDITPTALPLGPERSLFAVNDTVAVFGPLPLGDVDPANAFLQIVDLEQMTIDDVPLPDGVDPQMLNGGSLAFSPAGDLVIVEQDSGLSIPIAVLLDGAWSTNPTDLAAAHGIRASFLYDDSGVNLVGADSTGTIVWDSVISPISTEGFQFGVSDDVTVVAGCWEPLPEGEFCNRHEVGGVDTATGAVLWRLDGDRTVGVIGDGYAIVTKGDEAGGWLMVDTATGEPIPGQEWDAPGLFSTGCCEDVWNTTSRFGGVVVATHDRDLQVFLPDT